MDRWTIERIGAHGVARVDGELDLANARDLVELLVGPRAEWDCPVEVDLSGVTFIDSNGLNALLTAHRLLLERDAELTIVDPSACALRLLELTGCTQILTVVSREVEELTGTD